MVASCMLKILFYFTIPCRDKRFNYFLCPIIVDSLSLFVTYLIGWKSNFVTIQSPPLKRKGIQTSVGQVSTFEHTRLVLKSGGGYIYINI
jgi:hypothetical protein